MSLEWAVFIMLVIILATFFRGLRYSSLMEADHRIPVSEIELINFKISHPCVFSPRLIARVRNKSRQYTLTEIALQITMLDCVNDDCDVLGRRDELIWIEVPPGQERDVVEYVHISNTRQPSGKISWQYKILYATGR